MKRCKQAAEYTVCHTEENYGSADPQYGDYSVRYGFREKLQHIRIRFLFKLWGLAKGFTILMTLVDYDEQCRKHCGGYVMRNCEWKSVPCIAQETHGKCGYYKNRTRLIEYGA